MAKEQRRARGKHGPSRIPQRLAGKAVPVASDGTPLASARVDAMVNASSVQGGAELADEGGIVALVGGPRALDVEPEHAVLSASAAEAAQGRVDLLLGTDIDVRENVAINVLDA